VTKPHIAISIGDLNGIGIEIALKAHNQINKICTPHYCISNTMLQQAAKKLASSIPDDFITHEIKGNFAIEPGKVSAQSGRYSYDSFLHAVDLVRSNQCNAVVTLPIHKEAWEKAGIAYKGHTDMLRDLFKEEAIMMLGCEAMYVALYTEHLPYKEVASKIEKEKLCRFLLNLAKHLPQNEPIGVLGLNPHAGDNGVLGDEERIIEEAISLANSKIGKKIFCGALVPDTAFTPANRKRFRYFVAMYHDQGLIPLKALYFDESINISLNLPIIRTSVDHGTAFDIAYKNKASLKSYINAVNAAIEYSQTS